ncbi:MAG: insulinase family protein [Oscillospiraceae bacterium]|nr:insulinase family protein [Oscillospiraceae bacterium]
MESSLVSKVISNGISLGTVVSPRFKVNRITVNLILPLDQSTASVYAILPFLLRKSCEDYPDFSMLQRRLDELYGAALEGDVRKVGDNQILSLAATGIDDAYTLEGEKITGELASILSGALLRPAFVDGGFDPKELELEKNNLVDLIESEINDKRSYAINRMVEIMFGGEPYGINKYGNADEVKSLTAEQVTAAYHKAIETAKIEILFIGCGDSSKVEGIFKQAFESVLRNPVDITQSHVSGDTKEICHTDRMNVTQSKMVLGFRTGVEPKSPQSYALRLMTAIYGGTPFSLLFVNVREKLSLCYYCAARFDISKGILMVDCGVEDANIDRAREEILNQLESVKSDSFTDDEMSQAALSLKNSLNTIGDSVASLENWYLGQIILGLQDSPEDMVRHIAGVSRADIVDAANTIKQDTVYVLTQEGMYLND